MNDLKKRLTAIIKIRVPAMAASSKEPVGPSLGQYGIPIGEFCTKFNSLSQTYKEGTILNTSVFYYEDKTYDIVISIPNSSFFLIKATGWTKGARKPSRILQLDTYLPVITSRMLYEILLYTSKYNNNPINSSTFKRAKDSLKSMGLFYEDD